MHGLGVVTVVNAPVLVTTTYDVNTKLDTPDHIFWGSEDIWLTRIKLAGRSHVGSTIYLHYRAVDGVRRYELNLNLDSLQWSLDKVTDQCESVTSARMIAGGLLGRLVVRLPSLGLPAPLTGRSSAG